MAEPAISVEEERNRGSESGAPPSGLSEELAGKEEVLRLRDLLIAKDAELGVARGRLAELEVSSLQLLNPAARLRGFLPSFVWRALASLRRLRK